MRTRVLPSLHSCIQPRLYKAASTCTTHTPYCSPALHRDHMCRNPSKSLATARRTRCRNRALNKWRTDRACKGVNPTCCAICLDSVEPFVGSEWPQTAATLLVCDHLFHTGCFNEYVRHTVAQQVDRSSNDDEAFDAFLCCVAGPPCPVCRRPASMVHAMPVLMQDISAEESAAMRDAIRQLPYWDRAFDISLCLASTRF